MVEGGVRGEDGDEDEGVGREGGTEPARYV